MNTQRIAITIPSDLVAEIDELCKQRGMSRSRFISVMLREKVLSEKEKQLKYAYDRVFSDTSMVKEQLETSKWFNGTGSQEGQEW
jgi:metal-responsive CopG/Arc/MetJ family transcriptional regulator